jgi:hypothetical protein
MFSTLDWSMKCETDLGRSTILNEFECGRLGAASDPFGDWKTDYREFRPIYPPPAEFPSCLENADAGGAQAPAPAGVPTLEAEIAALVQEAQEGLRQLEDDRWRTGQDLRGQGSGNVSEFSATLPKNIDVKVNEPGLERRAWEPDIRINDPARASEAVSSRHAHASRGVLAVLVGTSLAIGWIVGLPPLQGHLPTAVEQKGHPSGEVADSNNRATAERWETNREATPRPGSTSKIAAAPAAGIPGHRREFAPNAPQQPKAVKAALVAPPTAAPSEPAASGYGRRTDTLLRSTPFPETKPTTIDGWTVRDVFGGTAVLEGPDGTRRAARGDSVPGLGRLESIVRWGNRWIVVTDRGLISTP